MAKVGNKELDNAAFSRLRRDLLREKGGELQEEFLYALQEDHQFLEFIGRIPVTGKGTVSLCPHPLTETEYREPPVDTQLMLYDVWEMLTPRIACRSSFWGNITCHHIRQGRIKAAYLAANGSYAGGAERIDRALRRAGKKRAKMMDDCVRTALRRLSGLPEARGNRTVYVDCPFARTWWRERLAVQVGRNDADLTKKVRDLVRLSKTYWEKLVVMIVSRNSVMGSHEIREAFVTRLAETIQLSGNQRLANAQWLVRACRNLSAVQAVRELSVLNRKELEDIMDLIIRAID